METPPHEHRALLKPSVVVGLGATAARSLRGRVVTLSKLRGQPIELADHSCLVVTIHPSYLLRIREEADKRREYGLFVNDLKLAAALLAKENFHARRAASR